MSFDPKNYAILLAGPRISRLQPFFEANGYTPTPFEDGETAIAELKRARYHLVCMELDLGDIESHEFLSELKNIQPSAAVMMIEDAAKTHMIVSSLVRGVDVYVQTPPDEVHLFEQCRRHCLAAAARGGGTGTRTQQLEKELENSRNMLETTGRKMRGLKDELRNKEEALTALQSQLDDAEAEQQRLTTTLETEKAEAAKAIADAKSAAAAKGEGTGDVDVEALRAQVEFVAFLESENDELKRERDGLLRRLREHGEVDDFDEPTGESDLSGSLDASLSDDDEMVFSVEDSQEAPAVTLRAKAEKSDRDNGQDASDEDDLVFSVEDSQEDDALADVDLSSVEGDGLRSGTRRGVEDESTVALPLPQAEPLPTARLPSPSVPADDIDDDEIAAILAEAAGDISDEDGAPFATSSGEDDDGRSVPPELLAAASQESDAEPGPLAVRDLHDMISPQRGGQRSPPVPRRNARAVTTKTATLGDARAALGEVMGEAGFGPVPAVVDASEGTDMTTAGADMLRVQASMNDMMASMQDLGDLDMPLEDVTVANATHDSSSAGGVVGSLESRTAAFAVPNAPESELERGAAFADVRTVSVNALAEPSDTPADAFEDVPEDVVSAADDFLDERTEARPMVAGDMFPPPPVVSAETRTMVIPQVTAPAERGAPVMSEAPFDDEGFDIDIETNAGEV